MKDFGRYYTDNEYPTNKNLRIYRDFLAKKPKLPQNDSAQHIAFNINILMLTNFIITVNIAKQNGLNINLDIGRPGKCFDLYNREFYDQDFIYITLSGNVNSFWNDYHYPLYNMYVIDSRKKLNKIWKNYYNNAIERLENGL